jgi:hypothetical protein
MPIIIIAILLLIIAFLLNKVMRSGNTGAPVAGRTMLAVEAAPAEVELVFLADGNLFHQAAGGTLQQIHSPYIQEVADKEAKSRERNAWKKGTTFEVAAHRGMRDFDPDRSSIVTTSVLFDQNGTLLYFLSDKTMGGLFAYDVAKRQEKRIMHRQGMVLTDMAFNPISKKIIASAYLSNGAANLALFDSAGDGYKELTGGDTVDAAPVPVPGEAQQFIYQSYGIARHAGGAILAYSHSTLQMLDLQSGEISAVADDARFDFISPKFDRRGNLLFIRRPYEAPRYAPESLLKDTLLFPFRLLRAVFHYLNFFSIMYSRKPLTSASGPAMQADIKEIMLKGKRINAEKALRREGQVQGVASLVPQSWQLVCRTRQGQEQVLAGHVASFDVAADGQIVYSNGRAVFALAEDGASSLILKSDLISDVFARQDLGLTLGD